MKKLLHVCLAMVLALTSMAFPLPASAADAPNLLSDGGFESLGEDGWFASWPINYPENNAKYVSVSSAAEGGAVHTGEHAIHVSRTDSTGDYQTLVIQGVPAVGGGIYRTVYWGMCEEKVAQQETLHVEMRDFASGSGSSQKLWVEAGTGTVGQWVERTFDFLLPQGKNMLYLTLFAKNFNGYVDDMRTFRIDPVFTLENGNNETAMSSEYEIVGTTGVQSTVDIVLNGEPVTSLETDAAGNFAYTVTLEEGENSIALSATSAYKYQATAGNPVEDGVKLTSTARLNVTYDPSKNIVLDQADQSVYFDTFTVSGSLVRPADVTIFVNGAKAAAIAGVTDTFTADVKLEPGDNEIEVVGTEADGNTTSAVIHVEYQTAYTPDNRFPDPSVETTAQINSGASLWDGNSAAGRIADKTITDTSSNDYAPADCVRTGNKSIRIRHTGSSGVGLKEGFSVPPNTNGRLTWWVKTTEAFTGSAPSVRLLTDKTALTLLPNGQASMNTANLNQWEQCSLEFNTGEFTTIYLRLEITAPGCLYLDDFSLTLDTDPAFTFDLPDNGVVGDADFALSGSVDQPIQAEISLNGGAARQANLNGQFSYPYTLLGGVNTFQIAYTTHTGKALSRIYTVHYKKVNVLDCGFAEAAITPGGTLHAAADVRNETADSLTAYMHVVLYDGNTMAAIGTKEVTLAPGQTEITGQLDVPAGLSAAGLRAKVILTGEGGVLYSDEVVEL